jgi:hypothetical protein
MEIGPYRVRSGGKLDRINGSWDEFANLLFVDNPVGTGFSYTDTDSYVSELEDMANQFIVFLEKWFKIFPEFAHDDVSIQTPPPVRSDAVLANVYKQTRSTLLASRMQVNIFLTSPKPFSSATREAGIPGTSKAS